ncbi:nadh-ubiquinone oxidoreductase chain g [hydrocarbon metagenome]|uniref:Nadh-ubiquinone oxidoreductase chain g n=1 Tax=hydrocarbon metagenome TaxID=938273 RepID=A0A0W8FXZ1_9ZZZZ
MPKLLINEREIEFKQGQTVIEVARDNGIEIPHYCWHPSLSVSGNCRVCLVEIEKMPKLVIACSTLAAEGMVVHTQSDKTLQARNAVMEFLLINHPLDCPICDEAGECKLQDYAFHHGYGESRFDEIKNRKEKRVTLGPRIMFDGDRCISCSRCIRFSDEIAKANQLTFVQRGDRVTIKTFPGEEFDNPYTLNTVDICPVGALTSRDFRFKARVWDMSETKTICPGCARGCNIDMWVRNNEILRLTPRENLEVNDYWMCDRGRLNTFKFVNAESRIDGALIRENDETKKVSIDEGIYKAAQVLQKYKANQIAFVGSAFATCEDNFALAKFARENFSANHIDFIRYTDENDCDDILVRADKTPNSWGAENTGIKPGNNGLNLDAIFSEIKKGNIKALFVMEDNPAAISDDYKNALNKLECLVVLAVNENETTSLANIVLPASAYAEKNGTFVNFEGRVQRIKPAVVTQEMERSLDGMSMSRLDKFGTKYDSWASGKTVNAKPSWQLLSLLSQKLGGKMNYQMAEDIFDDLVKSNKEFTGLDYDLIGEKGVQLESFKKVKETVLT